MVSFSEYDLIQAISGADEHGNGKCSTSIQAQRQDAEGNVVNTDDEFITEKPIVQMFKQAGGFVLVDFVFESVDDVDLQRMYSYLQSFFLSTNSVTDDELDYPLLVFSIVPEKLDGEYFAVGINPIFYALAPEDTKGEPKIIRLLFQAQEDPDLVPNFLFLKSDEQVLENIKGEVQEDIDVPQF